jgi:hypothetical protein
MISNCNVLFVERHAINKSCVQITVTMSGEEYNMRNILLLVFYVLYLSLLGSDVNVLMHPQHSNFPSSQGEIKMSQPTNNGLK